MKIYNFGSDYAFQLRKKKETGKTVVQSIVQPKTETAEDVKHQLQRGGETAVAETNDETDCGVEIQKAPEKGKRKKKEKTIDGLQEQE